MVPSRIQKQCWIYPKQLAAIYLMIVKAQGRVRNGLCTGLTLLKFEKIRKQGEHK